MPHTTDADKCAEKREILLFQYKIVSLDVHKTKTTMFFSSLSRIALYGVVSMNLDRTVGALVSRTVYYGDHACSAGQEMSEVLTFGGMIEEINPIGIITAFGESLKRLFQGENELGRQCSGVNHKHILAECERSSEDLTNVAHEA